MTQHSNVSEQLQKIKSQQERVLNKLSNRLKERSFKIEENDWLEPELTFRDKGSELRHFLKQKDHYDKLDQFPNNPSLTAKYSRKGFLQKTKTFGYVHLLTQANWEELLEQEKQNKPLSVAEVKESISKILSPEKVLNLVLLYHPFGFQQEALELQEGSLQGVYYQLYLIEDIPLQAFSVAGKSSGLRQLFDPEEVGEKKNRVLKNIEKNKKLSVRGGYVPVKELEKEWGISNSQLVSILQEVLPDKEGLHLEQIREMQILKRSMR